jgi:lipopolysaccharide/colanic/teichoic acid biosynthesis glycosyltransferase
MTGEDRTKAAGRRILLPLAGSNLLACLLGFSLAAWLYGGFAGGNYFGPWPGESIRQIIVSAFTAWIAIASPENPWSDQVRLWIDRLFSTVGFNLIVQYGLAYLFHILPTPWPVTVAGSVFAIALIAIFQKGLFHTNSENSDGTLLLGYDSVAESILPALGPRVIGVLGGAPERISSNGSLSPRPPLLGGLSQFDDVVASEKPGRIVINEPRWASAISPRRLLALRYEGVVVEDATTLFENLLKRVCWRRLDALDLLLSPRLNINRSALALQAVYTNVIGLALLVFLSPVLVLAAILVTLTTASPPLESAECPGLQRIPFRPLRFRTRRRNGSPAWSGKLLIALHLVHLPRLINVVRGEMALFGPPPVRKECADRLSQLIPVYAHRFIVKPGIMGWSQANLFSVLPAPDESLRLEYDLYYIREESPSLDLDILFRTVVRAPFHPADDSR